MAWWMWSLIVVGIIAVLLIWCYVSFSIGVGKAKKAREEIERVGGHDVWQKNIQARIERNNERVALSKASAKKHFQFANTLECLEQQIKLNKFSSVELEELQKDKEYATSLSKDAIKLANRTTKLIQERTSIIEKGISYENSSKLDCLDAEIEVLDRKHIAHDEIVFVSYTKIEKWVELGQSRS